MVPFFMPFTIKNFEKFELKDRKINIALMREKYLLLNIVILWIKSELLNNQKRDQKLYYFIFYRLNLPILNRSLQNIACQTNFTVTNYQC